MDIARNDCVAQLVAKSWNSKVKIITGIRRSVDYKIIKRAV